MRRYVGKALVEINWDDPNLSDDVKAYLQTLPMQQASYNYDDVSIFSDEQVAANIAKRKAFYQLITIGDVGHRNLTEDEVAYNKSLRQQQSQVAQESIRIWQENTASGKLAKVAGDALKKATGHESGGIATTYDEGYEYKIFHGDDGSFGIIISKESVNEKYELGPDGWYYRKIVDMRTVSTTPPGDKAYLALAEKIKTLKFI